MTTPACSSTGYRAPFAPAADGTPARSPSPFPRPQSRCLHHQALAVRRAEPLSLGGVRRAPEHHEIVLDAAADQPAGDVDVDVHAAVVATVNLPRQRLTDVEQEGAPRGGS